MTGGRLAARSLREGRFLPRKAEDDAAEEEDAPIPNKMGKSAQLCKGTNRL
ncbi:hypothetical protein ASY01nite_15230 [Acetobacter syzygii]|nr:hypothetical protein Absy_019_079 [Acetobacter syzygii]GBR65171.1 hypothetical protein AA0483_1726 [Acetobacter syzygii NRIC 0483]GEL56457.1 hypothetical protein ASY01nite_15230 [Acetobacter syzygii]